MPAYLIEDPENSGGDDILAPAAAATQAPPSSPPPQPAAADALTGDDVPEKYRGKTAAELLAIAREQESYIGRLGQEKGELRQRVGTLEGLVDKALKLRDVGDTGRQASPEDVLNDTDFARKPKEATSKLVDSKLDPVARRLDELDLKARALDFERAHPTAAADINDPAFVQFVEKSQRRQKLAAKAFGDPNNLDFDAADDLWEAWEEFKELKGGAAPAAATEGAPATSQPGAPAKAPEAPPALVSTTGSGGGGARGDKSGKPVYSASVLHRLQVENPEKYWAPDIQARIQEAYSEGRVTFP